MNELRSLLVGLKDDESIIFKWREKPTNALLVRLETKDEFHDTWVSGRQLYEHKDPDGLICETIRNLIKGK